MSRIKAVMKAHRLQQREVADGVGVSRETLSRWIHGRVPNGTHMISLVRYFRRFEPGLDVTDFDGGAA